MSTLTPEQRTALEMARLALASEKHAPAHTTGPDADGVWRGHFRAALRQVVTAFAGDGAS